LQATLNGCSIFYEVTRCNRPNAPCVLLLHGWGCDHAIFRNLTDLLSDRFTLITLDFPGHGQSGEPATPWDVTEYMQQIYALLQHIGVSEINVIAHSFGGRVALMLAARHPEMVRKMVLTGAAGLKKPETAEGQKRAAKYKRYTAFLNRMKRNPALVDMAEKLQAALRNRYGSPDYIKLNENMRKSFVRIISQDLRPLLPSIQASTLLIWGDADTETPIWMGQTMEKEIPDAGLVVFEGGTHFAFLEQGPRFALITKQFFGEESA